VNSRHIYVVDDSAADGLDLQFVEPGDVLDLMEHTYQATLAIGDTGKWIPEQLRAKIAEHTKLTRMLNDWSVFTPRKGNWRPPLLWANIVRLALYTSYFKTAATSMLPLLALRTRIDEAVARITHYWRQFGVVEGSACDCNGACAAAQTGAKWKACEHLPFSEGDLRTFASCISLYHLSKC
jgi:hypothetical protein